MLLQPNANLSRGNTLRTHVPAAKALLGSASLGLLLVACLPGCVGQIEEAAEPPGGALAIGVEGDGAAILDEPNAATADFGDTTDIADPLQLLESGIGVESLLASIEDQRYREGFPWLKVNEVPFQSAVAPAMIDVWVSGVGAQAYASVAPEHRVRGEDVPPGTLVVREVWNDAGEVSKLTLMLKGPPGYNPELGDFWFGETDANGAPLEDEAGQPRLGKLDGCYGCHVPRAEQGYLFGAPAGNRMPYLEGE